MKITTIIETIVERADGTVTRVSETFVAQAGDNPRFESDEVAQAVHEAMDQKFEKIRSAGPAVA